MDAEATIRAYYDALRAGEPLGPFFADAEGVVKFGISERLTGHDEVVAGLRAQTETTTDWTVESERLSVVERDGYAWFSDDVTLGWTDLERSVRFSFETRWSGTLERRAGDGDGDGGEDDPDWEFVLMHVSAPGDL